MELSDNELLILAKKELNNVKLEQEFCVRDLFVGHFWDNIKKANRISLGRLFFKYVEEESNGYVVPTSKSNSNQQKYKKPHTPN